MKKVLQIKFLNRYLVGLFSCLVILSFFINCSKNRFFESQRNTPIKDVDQKIENSENNIYVGIAYDVQNTPPSGESAVTTTRLEINLEKQTVVYSVYSGFIGGWSNTRNVQFQSREQCRLEDHRSQQLKEILHQASVCQPAPAPPGSIQCQAIAIPDIALITMEKTVELSAVICGTGVYLCEGKDGQLRALLIDIKNKKPANGSCSIL